MPDCTVLRSKFPQSSFCCIRKSCAVLYDVDLHRPSSQARKERCKQIRKLPVCACIKEINLRPFTKESRLQQLFHTANDLRLRRIPEYDLSGQANLPEHMRRQQLFRHICQFCQLRIPAFTS